MRTVFTLFVIQIVAMPMLWCEDVDRLDPLIASKILSIREKRDQIVGRADADALIALRSLYKKVKSVKTRQAIASVIVRYDPTDDEMKKIVAEIKTDGLLDDIGDPGVTMVQAKAELISKAGKTGKLTEADWSALKGFNWEVGNNGGSGGMSGTQKEQLKAGRTYVIIPNLADKFGADLIEQKSGQWDATKLVFSYTDGKTIQNKVEIFTPFTVPSDVTLSAKEWAARYYKVGSARIKVYEVVPNP